MSWLVLLPYTCMFIIQCVNINVIFFRYKITSLHILSLKIRVNKTDLEDAQCLECVFSNISIANLVFSLPCFDIFFKSC